MVRSNSVRDFLIRLPGPLVTFQKHRGGHRCPGYHLTVILTTAKTGSDPGQEQTSENAHVPALVDSGFQNKEHVSTHAHTQ